LDAMQVSLKEIYEDPQMQLILDNIFSRTSGLDQTVRFDILMNLQSGQLNPMATNAMFDLIGDNTQAAKILNLIVDVQGLDSANQFLLENLMLSNEATRKKYIIEFAVESGADATELLDLLGFGPQRESDLQNVLDKAIGQLEWAESRGFSGEDLRNYRRAVYDAEAALRSFREERGRAIADMAMRKMDRDPALKADAARWEAQSAAWQSAKEAGRSELGPQDISTGIDAGIKSLEQFITLSAQAQQKYDLVVESIESKGIRVKVDSKSVAKTDKELNKITEVLNEFDELPEEMQKTVNVDTLQAAANMEAFNLDWSNVGSFEDLQKQISVLDGFSSPMQAFGMSWAQYNSLPNIYKQIVLQYVVATAEVKGFYSGQRSMTSGGNLSAADRTDEFSQRTPNPVVDTPYVPPKPSTGGGRTTTPPPGGSGGSGSGGGEKKKTGADLVKEMIEELKLQLKFLGDYKKKNGEVVSGFAQALRSAGAPEQLIADIISKGEEGIKIAKELLKDKAKKLKEVTNLMLKVTRLTFVEAQRAEAANLAAQTSAQMALANAGINPSVVADMDPEQARAVAAGYTAYQQAQKRADAAKDKSKAKQKEANRALAAARQEWEMVTKAIKENTAAQEKNAIVQALLEAQQERINAQNQVSASLSLAGRKFTAEQIGSAMEVEGAANQIVAYEDKIKSLREEMKKLNEKGRKDWSKEEKKRYSQLQKQLQSVTKDYRQLLNTLRNISKEQGATAIANTTVGFAAQASAARRQRNAQNILMGQGYTYDQASSLAGDEESAKAIVEAQNKVGRGEKRVNDLLKERSKYKVGSEKYKELSAKIREARAELKEAKNAQDNLNKSIADVTREQVLLDWQSLQQELNKEIVKQANNQKFIAMGVKDQLVLNRLNNMTLEQQNHFLSLSKQEQEAFLKLISDSIPLSEKLAQAFEKIASAQRLQSLLNEEAANKYMGKTTEEYDDQLKLLGRSIRAQQDLLKIQQRRIEVIEEENEDLNRGLELLSRQEEKINEAFDNRLEALDNVEKANARIAKQQQNQLNLSQALASGDIYAATQAAQQIKQDNATAAIENTREALEKAREEQLKNLVVEVNGQLLTREQIEKRIIANNDIIYQIQEDQIEPIEKVIQSLEDQSDAVNRLKEQWQDYYDTLEKNAVDPITGLKYKDLNRLKDFYDAIFNAQEVKDAGKALQDAIAATGIGIDQATFFSKFGINTTPVVGAVPTQPGGATTQDVGAAKEAAIQALPEVQKVLDVAKNIKKAIGETPSKIIDFAKSLTDNAQPVIDTTRGKVGGIIKKFKEMRATVLEDLIPNALTPFKEFLEGGLLSAANSVVDAFKNMNSQITRAIENVAKLATSLSNLERNIVINITVNTTYTSSGTSEGGNTSKPKKFMGGLIKMATGGMIPGGIPRDSVPILASPGEFVVRNAMVDKYGPSMLSAINQGSFEPSFRTPSMVTYTKINRSMEADNSRTMYNNNYSINVTANTNANADEIASATVMKIRQMNSMQIRGARG